MGQMDDCAVFRRDPCALGIDVFAELFGLEDGCSGSSAKKAVAAFDKSIM